ncbi:hypothetical protein AAMO2058_000371200 [Amorphochlora amoebiformis]
MEYIAANILDAETYPDGTEVSLPGIYIFVADRSRAVLNDLVPQNLPIGSLKVALSVLRFHVLFDHLGQGLDAEVFEDARNLESFTKAFTTVRECVEKGHPPEGADEAYSYNLLLSLDPSSRMDFVREYSLIPAAIRRTPYIQVVRRLHRAVESGNYVRFFQIVRRELGELQTCLASRAFRYVRRRALFAMARGYHKKSMPLSSLARQLGFETLDDAITCCADYELTMNADRSQVEFNNAMPPSSLRPRISEGIVSSKLVDIERGDLIRGKGPFADLLKTSKITISTPRAHVSYAPSTAPSTSAQSIKFDRTSMGGAHSTISERKNAKTPVPPINLAPRLGIDLRRPVFTDPYTKAPMFKPPDSSLYGGPKPSEADKKRAKDMEERERYKREQQKAAEKARLEEMARRQRKAKQMKDARILEEKRRKQEREAEERLRREKERRIREEERRRREEIERKRREREEAIRRQREHMFRVATAKYLHSFYFDWKRLWTEIRDKRAYEQHVASALTTSHGGTSMAPGGISEISRNLRLLVGPSGQTKKSEQKIKETDTSNSLADTQDSDEFTFGEAVGMGVFERNKDHFERQAQISPDIDLYFDLLICAGPSSVREWLLRVLGATEREANITRGRFGFEVHQMLAESPRFVLFHSMTLVEPSNGMGRDLSGAERGAYARVHSGVIVVDEPLQKPSPGKRVLSPWVLRKYRSLLVGVSQLASPPASPPVPILIICKVPKALVANNQQLNTAGNALRSALVDPPPEGLAKENLSRLFVLALACSEIENGDMYPDAPDIRPRLGAALGTLAKWSRPYPRVFLVLAVQTLERILNCIRKKLTGRGVGVGWWIEVYNSVLRTLSSLLISRGLSGLAWPPLSCNAQSTAEDEEENQHDQTTRGTSPVDTQALARALKEGMLGSFPNLGNQSQEAKRRLFRYIDSNFQPGPNSTTTADLSTQLVNHIQTQLTLSPTAAAAAERSAFVLIHQRVRELGNTLLDLKVNAVYTRIQPEEVVHGVVSGVLADLKSHNQRVGDGVDLIQVLGKREEPAPQYRQPRQNSKAERKLIPQPQPQTLSTFEAASGSEDPDEWLEKREMDALLQELDEEERESKRLLEEVDGVRTRLEATSFGVNR